MQMSRSVKIPITRGEPPSSCVTIGTQPQSFSHMSCAALLRESTGEHVHTSCRMICLTFNIVLSPRAVADQTESRPRSSGRSTERPLHEVDPSGPTIQV